MLSPNEQILVKGFAEKTADMVRNAIKTKRITKYGAANSSGRLLRSVEIKYTDNGFQILANDYIVGLITGVKPGETTATIGQIKQWINEKPLKAEIPIDSLAVLILNKLKKSGNMVWRTHKGANSGLLDEPLKQERFDSFIELIATKAVEDLADDVFETFDLLEVA